MTDATPRKTRTLLRTAATIVSLAALVVVGLLYLSGTFHRKVSAPTSAPAGRELLPGTATATVQRVRMAVLEPAVGTIRPVSESSVASKIMERIVEMNVHAGQNVRQGDVLVRLDDASLKNRLAQARAALSSAQALCDQADTRRREIQAAYDKQVATKVEIDEADNRFKAAQGDLSRANDAVQEALINLDNTVIRSPIDGIVVDKKADVGDTVAPGQTLLTMYNRMQMVASVRESLAGRLKVGQSIGVHIDALNHSCTGTVSEIVPQAQSASRAFQVKVTGPCEPGVYTGMFGRLLIPLDDETVLLLPAAAVRRIGQLDMVDVVETAGGHRTLSRRAVTLGRAWKSVNALDAAGKPVPLHDVVEVLSGLSAGQIVALDAQGGAS